MKKFSTIVEHFHPLLTHTSKITEFIGKLL
jgi:hypothetical protein